MNEHDAAGTRVAERPGWRSLIWFFLTGGLYRFAWIWAINDELRRFGRARVAGERPMLRARPGLSVLAMVLAVFGYATIAFSVLPWSNGQIADVAPEAGSSDWWTSLAFGAAMLVPALVSAWRTAGRVLVARTLAGMPRPARALRLRLLLLLPFELVGAPFWMFLLQAELNDVWRCYPRLEEVDLFGELAPPAERDALVARRPEVRAVEVARRGKPIEDRGVLPLVTGALIVVCIAAFAWQVARFGFDLSARELERSGGLKRHLDHEWLRWITANFLHGSVGHIASNLTVWVLFAPRVERAWGSRRLLALVAVGTVSSSAGLWVSGLDVVAIGASGIVFAVLGAGIARDPKARTGMGRLCWWISVPGLLSSFAPGIGTGAHLGGFVGGLVFGLVLRGAWRMPADWAEEREHRPRVPIDHDAVLAPSRAAEQLVVATG